MNCEVLREVLHVYYCQPRATGFILTWYSVAIFISLPRRFESLISEEPDYTCPFEALYQQVMDK